MRSYPCRFDKHTLSKRLFSLRWDAFKMSLKSFFWRWDSIYFTFFEPNIKNIFMLFEKIILGKQLHNKIFRSLTYTFYNKYCPFPASICLLKANNSNTRKTWSHWRRSSVFIVNFEYVSHIFLVLLLLTLNK